MSQKIYQKLINPHDLVQFDSEDFKNVGKATFFVESDSFDNLSLPASGVKTLFIRITSDGRMTLKQISAIGEKLSTKFPNAQIRWAFGVENKNMLQVLGI